MSRLALSLLMLLSGVEVALAQTPLRLTLADATIRGIDASHRLAELDARGGAARAVEDQRKATERPQGTLP